MTKYKDIGDHYRDGTLDPSSTRAGITSEMEQQAHAELIQEAEEANKRAEEANARLQRFLGTKDPELSRELLNESAPLVSSFADRAFDLFEARQSGKSKPISLPWSHLNNVLNGGLWPGVYVVVGNTGTGKSQLALQAALHAAQREIPVLYIGLELGQNDFTARLTGLIRGEPWNKILFGKHEVPIHELKASLASTALPIRFVTAGPYGWSYQNFDPLVKAMRETCKKPFLVVLDYLQIIASPAGKNEDLRYRIQQASYAAHHAALKYDASVLMLSSTAREHYPKLSGKDPKVGEPAYFLQGLGKESGEIEYSATGVVIMAKSPELNDDGVPGSGEIDENSIHLGIAKYRFDRAGDWVCLGWDGSKFGEKAGPGIFNL